MDAASAHHRTKEPDMAALDFGSGPLILAPEEIENYGDDDDRADDVDHVALAHG